MLSFEYSDLSMVFYCLKFGTGDQFSALVIGAGMSGGYVGGNSKKEDFRSKGSKKDRDNIANSIKTI